MRARKDFRTYRQTCLPGIAPYNHSYVHPGCLRAEVWQSMQDKKFHGMPCRT